MSALKAQVGALIRHYRRSRGWSQDELAARAGRSVEMINRIERGRVAPSFDTLEALAAALEVTVRDFFGTGSVAAGTGSDQLQRLISKVAGLSPDDLTWVDNLLAVALSRRTPQKG